MKGLFLINKNNKEKILKKTLKVGQQIIRDVQTAKRQYQAFFTTFANFWRKKFGSAKAAQWMSIL